MCIIKRLVLENMWHHTKPRSLKQRDKSCDKRNKVNAEMCEVKTGLIVGEKLIEKSCRVWNESWWSHLLSPVVWVVVEVCCWWELWSRRRWGYLKQRPTKKISNVFRWARWDSAIEEILTVMLLSTECTAVVLGFVILKDVAVILSTPCTACCNITQTLRRGLNSDCAEAKQLLRSQMLACRWSSRWTIRR